MISHLVKPFGVPFTLESRAERKRLVLILRSMVIATAAYLVLDGTPQPVAAVVAYVFLFAASNVALGFVPGWFFAALYFGPILFLADTAVILFGLSWSQGLQQELLIAYFLTLFLVTTGETLGQIAVGSALIAGIYGSWMTATGDAATPVSWALLPFLFFVAVFYASLIDQMKQERHRRRAAEEENRHLRLVLDLADSFSERHPSRAFVLGLGRFIEATCPGLDCQLVLGPEPSPPFEGAAFPLRAHGGRYGRLCVRRIGGGSLSTREQWLCQIVAHAAAGALYSAEKTSASESAERTKEQFLAVLSHELRTPLHAILGYVEMLDSLLTEDADPLMRDGVDRARANAKRLQGRLEDLLGFAEMRSGQASVQNDAVPVGALLVDLVTAARQSVGRRPLTVDIQLPPEEVEVVTDEARLRQALSCVLDNAVRFTLAGQVTVRLVPVRSGFIRVSIEDTGIGIAEADLARILGEFRQADESTTRRFDGLGIGLSLTREIARLLGGTIEMDSQVGQGTRVHFTLPVAPAGSRAAHETSADAAELSQRKLASWPT